MTYVDRDSFAFGHHFEAGGTVDYIASLAEIICIMQSEDQPYKQAPLDPIGRITQDDYRLGRTTRRCSRYRSVSP